MKIDLPALDLLPPFEYSQEVLNTDCSPTQSEQNSYDDMDQNHRRNVAGGAYVAGPYVRLGRRPCGA
jgi:hypothetical protein